MIKKASKVYKMENIPPSPKLWPSSASLALEQHFIFKEKLEEYNLYRKQEIIFISEFINFYKNKSFILKILNSKCSIYNTESSFDLLDIYLSPNINNYHIDVNRIVKYSLNIRSNLELKTFICDKMENLAFNCMAVELSNYLGSHGIWFKYKKNILVNLNYLWYFIDDIYLTF